MRVSHRVLIFLLSHQLSELRNECHLLVLILALFI